MPKFASMPSDDADGTYVTGRWNELKQQYEDVLRNKFPNQQDAINEAKELNDQYKKEVQELNINQQNGSLIDQ